MDENDTLSWEELGSETPENYSEGSIRRLIRAFTGATFIAVKEDGVIAERGRRRPSKKTTGKFALAQIEAAEQQSRRKGARGGRPILFR
ncbi:hypothetical protein ANRL1_01333 [Anaerolineae bacterium]|nr:hypothetical protein ANRL1_01333 [Anaerolineae bacterium]